MSTHTPLPWPPLKPAIEGIVHQAVSDLVPEELTTVAGCEKAAKSLQHMLKKLRRPDADQFAVTAAFNSNSDRPFVHIARNEKAKAAVFANSDCSDLQVVDIY